MRPGRSFRYPVTGKPDMTRRAYITARALVHVLPRQTDADLADALPRSGWSRHIAGHGAVALSAPLGCPCYGGPWHGPARPGGSRGRPMYWRRLQPISDFAFPRDDLWVEQVDVHDGSVRWGILQPRENVVVAAAEVDGPCR